MLGTHFDTDYHLQVRVCARSERCEIIERVLNLLHSIYSAAITRIYWKIETEYIHLYAKFSLLNSECCLQRCLRVFECVQCWQEYLNLSKPAILEHFRCTS